MTVRMDQMNTMFRDFKVAEDVAKMMEMRRFETEYTMYGRMFFENSERRYIISSSEDKIIDIAENRQNFAKNPLPVIKHTLRINVPAGNEEEITRFVKLKLAEIIRNSYTAEFLEQFLYLCQTPHDNAADEILSELAERLAGVYRKDNLQLFEGMLDMAYQAKHLLTDCYERYVKWLSEEYKQMEDDPLPTEQFIKNMYGIGYKQDGKYKTYLNAEKGKVYQKKYALEKSGILASQVWSKECGYNYEKTLSDIRKEFDDHLKEEFDATYFAYLAKIKSLPTAINAADFAKWQFCAEQGSQAMKNAVKMYALKWQIS